MRLRVDRFQLELALRAIQRAEARERHRATVSFVDGSLTLTFGVVAVSADAEGSWSGEVRVLAGDMRALFVSSSGTTRIDVQMRDGRFWVGRSSVPCTWRSAKKRR